MSGEFQTKEACDANRENCGITRGLQIQNLILTMRAETRIEIDGMRDRIEEKFAQVLRAAGYAGEELGDTGVQADGHHHPLRRDKDVSWRQRVLDWIFTHATGILIAILCLVVGSASSAKIDRITEALTAAIIRGLQ